MAKIIEPGYKFKPVKCRVCGCTYVHEQGDDIEVISTYSGTSRLADLRRLACPVCGNDNPLEVEVE